MAWLAVDENGCECIFSHKPIRGNLYFENDESYCDSTCVELPIDSIEKLIGRELTWYDEPVEI